MGVTYLIITALGSAKIQWNYFLQSTLVINKKNAVLLTFDDGPHHIFTPVILDILKEHDIKAIFFLIGKNAEAHPDLVKRILREGHTIGNHSYSHQNQLPLFSLKRLHEDISTCTQIIYRITGIRTQLFRPPFGVTTPRYAEVLQEEKLDSVGWSLRSMDTVIKSATKLTDKMNRNIIAGDIVLFHDRCSVTVEALNEIIRLVQTKKLMFASPEECFAERYGKN